MADHSRDEIESELVGSAQRGNWAAFAELVRRHQAAVRACLAVRMDQPHEAEDLAQEAFATAFRARAIMRSSAGIVSTVM